MTLRDSVGSRLGCDWAPAPSLLWTSAACGHPALGSAAPPAPYPRGISPWRGPSWTRRLDDVQLVLGIKKTENSGLGQLSSPSPKQISLWLPDKVCLVWLWTCYHQVPSSSTLTFSGKVILLKGREGTSGGTLSRVGTLVEHCAP